MKKKIYIIYLKITDKTDNDFNCIIKYIGVDKNDAISYFDEYSKSHFTKTADNKECAAELYEFDSPWTRVKSLYTMDEPGILLKQLIIK